MDSLLLVIMDILMLPCLLCFIVYNSYLKILWFHIVCCSLALFTVISVSHSESGKIWRRTNLINIEMNKRQQSPQIE